MRGVAAFIVVFTALALVVVLQTLGEPLLALQDAANGQAARIVPATDPLTAGCRGAEAIGDAACNLVVKEYGADTMVVIWFGMLLLVAVAVGVMFFLAAMALGGGGW